MGAPTDSVLAVASSTFCCRGEVTLQSRERSLIKKAVTKPDMLSVVVRSWNLSTWEWRWEDQETSSRAASLPVELDMGLGHMRTLFKMRGRRDDDAGYSGHRHGWMGGFRVGFHPRQSELETWHWESQPCRFGEDQTVCPPLTRG